MTFNQKSQKVHRAGRHRKRRGFILETFKCRVKKFAISWPEISLQFLQFGFQFIIEIIKLLNIQLLKSTLNNTVQFISLSLIFDQFINWKFHK